MMTYPVFPLLDIDDFAPSQLHTQMGFGKAAMEWFVLWIYNNVQVVGYDYKEARLAYLRACEEVKGKVKARNEALPERVNLIKQLKIDVKIYKKWAK
jgi:hypothetical protein